MEYGHTTDIDSIDFTLPEDHASNDAFLKSLNKTDDFKVYVGCAKWGIKEWVGMLYPEGTKDGDFLKEYSQRFNSVELNTTGYRFGSAKRMAEWAAQAPDGFTFSPKFPQIITQFKLLGDVQDQTERFVESISGFGDKLGMPFLLLPDRFKPERMDKVAAFFDKIPKGFPVSFEFRHPEFYSSEQNKITLASILREHNAPWIITDSAGERNVIHQVVTSSTVFIRFSGCDNLEIDTRRMKSWVDRISSWKKAGAKKVYWYAHNIPEVKTPLYAAIFSQQINQSVGLTLNVPEIRT